MVYRFLILSDEVDKFKREIKISAEATFLDLHKAILKTVGFDPNEMYSFFICDDDWSKKTEITLVDMDASSDEDVYLMEDTPLEELLEDEHQKMLYVFDYMTERSLFMDLSEIIPREKLSEAICSLSVGLPPSQSLSANDFKQSAKNIDLGEDFYGDAEFDEDELPLDGFEEDTPLEDLEDKY